MDDGRGVSVQVGKAQGYVVEHGDLQVARDVGLRLNAGRQARGQVLHNNHGCARSLFYVDAQKLHNVRVPQVAQQVALLLELCHHVPADGRAALSRRTTSTSRQSVGAELRTRRLSSDPAATG